MGWGAGPTFVFLSPAVKMYRMNTQLLDSGAVGRLENSNFRLKKEKKIEWFEYVRRADIRLERVGRGHLKLHSN
jgi:hypothetical protein